MLQINNRQCFLYNIHAKCLEIFLIISFLLSIVLLIVNLVITLWFFKLSYILLILEIWLLVLNAFTFIFSVILRIWRSDGSFNYKNFSSSLCLSSFNIVLIIINILLSLVEEILFYFVYSNFGFFLKMPKDINSFERIAKIIEKIMNNKNYVDKIYEIDEDEND